MDKLAAIVGELARASSLIVSKMAPPRSGVLATLIAKTVNPTLVPAVSDTGRQGLPLAARRTRTETPGSAIPSHPGRRATLPRSHRRRWSATVSNSASIVVIFQAGRNPTRSDWSVDCR